MFFTFQQINGKKKKNFCLFFLTYIYDNTLLFNLFMMMFLYYILVSSVYKYIEFMRLRPIISRTGRQSNWLITGWIVRDESDSLEELFALIPICLHAHQAMPLYTSIYLHTLVVYVFYSAQSPRVRRQEGETFWIAIV